MSGTAVVPYDSVLEPGGGYGFEELDDPGNSEKSVEATVLEGGYSDTVLDVLGSSLDSVLPGAE